MKSKTPRWLNRTRLLSHLRIPAAVTLTFVAAAMALFAASPPTPGANVRVTDDAKKAARSKPGDLLWEDRFDASRYEQAFSVATLNDSVFAAGFTRSASGFGRDFVIRSYDARTGALEWQDQVDKGSDEFASGVVTDKQRVFVSGTTFIAGHDYDWLLRAYDARSGDLLWENVFDLNGRSDFSRGTALAVGNGIVFLGGYGTKADGNADWLVRAYNAASGALVWQDHYESGPNFDTAYTLVVDGDRLFAGGAASTESAGIAVVRAYNARTGALLWQRDTPGIPDYTYTNTITVRDGRVFVGSVVPPNPAKFVSLVQAYDARSGALLWQDRIDKGGDLDFIEQITADEGRLYAVSGGGQRCIFEASPPSDCNAITRTYDAATGALLWERELDLSGIGIDDYASLVAAAGKRTVFVFSQKAATNYVPGCCVVGQWVVQAFDGATGELRWESTAGELDSALYNMIIDHGRLLIPGRSIDPATGNWDFIVRAYDARNPNSDDDQDGK
jgi:hypothetical protein